MNLAFNEFSSKLHQKLCSILNENYNNTTCHLVTEESGAISQTLIYINDPDDIGLLGTPIDCDNLYTKYQSSQNISKLTMNLLPHIIVTSYGMESHFTDTHKGQMLSLLDDLPHNLNKVCRSVVNYKNNEEWLQNIPHRKYLDLAIVYYLCLDTLDGPKYSIITNELLNYHALNEETLFLKSQVRDYNIFYNAKRVDNSLIPFRGSLKSLNIINHLISVKATKGRYGASCLLYPRIFAWISQQLQLEDSLYIVPCSTNEIICVDSALISSSDLLANVKESFATSDDKLSDYVYEYSLWDGRIKQKFTLS